MTGPPGAVQVDGSWGLGTGDTPTWPGVRSGAWPIEMETEEERQGPQLGPGPLRTTLGPQLCLPPYPSPESRGCTKAGPLGPSEVKPRATELVGPYEVTVPAWLDVGLVPRGNACPPADCT